MQGSVGRLRVFGRRALPVLALIVLLLTTTGASWRC